MSTTGPFVRTTSTPFPDQPTFRRFYRTQTWYRQGKPRVLPLAFLMRQGRAFKGDAPNNWEYLFCSSRSETESAFAEANNKCYSRFISKMHDRASVGVAIMERRQTLNMIVDAAGKLIKAIRLVRRGHMSEALQTLGLNARSGLRFASKDFADRWLEIHYGWVPLLNDIYDVIGVLQSEYPVGRIKARANARLPLYNLGPVRGSSTAGWGRYYDERTYHLTVKCERRAIVAISNPNLYRANQLGVLNPASIIWETIPFSFLIDWFANVGDFLNSWSDLAGITLYAASTTTLSECSGEMVRVYIDQPKHTAVMQGGHACHMTRAIGIGVPILSWNMSTFSTTRAGNAIALTVQRLVR